MTLNNALYTRFKSLLGEEKEGDSTLLDLVSGYFDKSEEVPALKTSIEKLETANKELVEKRTKWEEDNKTLQKSVKDKDAEILRLQNGQLSDEDRKKLEEYKKSGMSEDVKLLINKLEDRVKTSDERVEALEKKDLEKDKLLKETTEKAAKTTMIKNLTNELNSVGITGNNTVMALAYLESAGHAKINVNGEEITEQYIINKDGKDLPATVKELAEHFAEKNENLVDSSGRDGTDQDHNNGSFTKQNSYKTLDDIKMAANNMMKETT